MDAAARVGNSNRFGFSSRSTLNFANHLTQVQLRHDKRFRSSCEFANALLWKRPAGDQTKLSHTQTTLASKFNRALRNAGRDAVGHNDYVGALQPIFFEQSDAVGGIVNLALQAPDQ